jgi:hypothetical protein
VPDDATGHLIGLDDRPFKGSIGDVIVSAFRLLRSASDWVQPLGVGR